MQAASIVDLKVDERIKDAPRVMRVPGFTNQKRKKPAKLVKVTKEATYPLDEFPMASQSWRDGHPTRQSCGKHSSTRT